MPSTQILMSIQPRFAKLILDGEKPYELRRMRPRFKEGDRVIIYASREIGRIIGFFQVGVVLSGNVEQVWQAILARRRHRDDTPPLSESGFFAYLSGARVASAIEIRNPRRLESPLALNSRAPQSHQCLSQDNPVHRELLDQLPPA